MIDKEQQEIIARLNKSTFIDCCILSEDYFGFLGVEESPEDDLWEKTPPLNLFLYVYEGMENEGVWYRTRWKDGGWSFPKLVHTKLNECLITDSNGHVFYHGTGKNKVLEGRITIDGEEWDIANIKNIHGTVYAVNRGRSVLRRDGPKKWINFAEKLNDETTDKMVKARKKGGYLNTGFRCIDGFKADDDLYAAGDASDVWRFDKKLDLWTPIDLGRYKREIKCICCAEDGKVYMGTQGGTLIIGRNDSWMEIVPKFAGVEQVWDVVWFKGRLYIATARRLYELADEEVIPVRYNAEDGLVPSDAANLYANAGWLMSVGNYSVAIYNGEQWKVLYGKSEVDDATAKALATGMFKQALDNIEKLEDL